jgi:hypothetical protein
MPPFMASHIARAMAADESLGINNVSGFYGPGSWIAWYLTLATSWVAVIRNDHSNNLHHIGYLLYVNWAAIDVIRKSVQVPLDATDTDSRNISSNGPLGAALVVTWWGVVHATLQFTYSILSTGGAHDPLYFNVRRRSTLLKVGVILPSIAGLVCFIYIPREDFGQPIPALCWDGMVLDRSRHISRYICAAALWSLCSSTTAVLLVDCSRFWPSSLERTPKEHICLTMLFYLIGFIPVSLSLPYLLALTESGLSGRGIWQKSCFFMPCAPHNLMEWDQAFPVFRGVFMVGYEFGLGHMPQLLRSFKHLLAKLDNFQLLPRNHNYQRLWPTTTQNSTELNRYRMPILTARNDSLGLLLMHNYHNLKNSQTSPE